MTQLSDSISLTEKEVLVQLNKTVDEMESFTRVIKYKELEQPLGFFFARVLNNKITRSTKNKLEFELAIVRAAAFVIVIQFLFFTLLFPKIEKIRYKIEMCKDVKDFQVLLNELVPTQHYSLIFNTHIIELLPKNSTPSLKKVVNILLNLQIQRFKGDILGRIFQSLIPFNLRKFLAAFYTSNITSNFLAKLVIKKVDLNILDPACGSGTILVSSYNRLKELDKKLTHRQILQNLYGLDVSVFAAQLAAINLFLKDPEDTLQRPHIIIQDLFKFKANSDFTGKRIKLPYFDVIIGNPPFTRGDRLDSEYKDFLETHLSSWGISVDYSKKSVGYYAYFLLDSIRLLKESGILAFILPLSLINSTTMKPVLNFLLKNFNLKYLVISDAQVTFSEQSTFKELVLIAQKKRFNSKSTFDPKFVVLKKELSHDNFANLAEKIESVVENYEDSTIRIRIVSNFDLANSIELNWILYFYSTSFFNLFNTIINSKAITYLEKIVKIPRYDVDRGLRAGISDFFYLPNKFWRIMDENADFITIGNTKDPNFSLNLPTKNLLPVMRKSSLYNKIIPKISEYILIVSNRSKNNESINEYIKWGRFQFSNQKKDFEKLTYNHITKGRKIARVGIIHKLSLNNGKFLSYYTPTPTVMTDNFIFIRTHNEELDKIIAAYLNSTIFLMMYFILRREKSGALGQIFGTDMRKFYCLNPLEIAKNDRDELCSIFDKFINKSIRFPPFIAQIKQAQKRKTHIRYILDKKICDILNIPNPTDFISNIYKNLRIELKKFEQIT